MSQINGAIQLVTDVPIMTRFFSDIFVDMNTHWVASRLRTVDIGSLAVRFLFGRLVPVATFVGF